MKYKNTEPPFYPQPFSDFFKWAVADKLQGRRRESPRSVRVPTATPNEALIRSDSPSLTWIGHATWLIRLGGKTILTDPNWSDSLGPGVHRNVAAALPIENFPPDVVVVSHNHRDHLDAPTIKKLGGKPHYVVPEGLGPFFKKRDCAHVTELEWWSEVKIENITVTFVPSQHWSQRGAFDRNDTLWGGFVISDGKTSVYFAGDTSYFGGFKEIGRRFPSLDAALLPIGAYDPEWFMRKQHMNPDDAMQAFLDLGAKRLCAMHWGTFKLTDEPLDEPPQLLIAAQKRANLAEDRMWIAAIGESLAL